MKTELKRFYQRAAGMLRHAKPTSPSAHKGRTLVTLLIMLLTTATGWAQDAIDGLTYNTAGEYYEINDAQDLADLATYVNGGNETQGKTFKVTQDIVFTHTTDWNDASSTEDNYTAIGGYIGNSYHYFNGHFDGQGHTISGIRIYKGGNTTDDRYQGLFGYIDDKTAEVKNVILADARITGYWYVGGIVGKKSKGTVSNCHVRSDVTIHAVQSVTRYHGGIVGENFRTIEGCTSAASITTTATGNAYYGGIAGSNAWIQDTDYVGTITDCLYLGDTVEGSADVGAIAGKNGGRITNSYFSSNTFTGKGDTSPYELTNANSAVGYNDTSHQGYGTTDNVGRAYSVTAGDYVTIETITPSGEVARQYTPDGIKVYGDGFVYNGGFYCINNSSTVSLTLSHSRPGYDFGGYTATAGTLSGDSNPYSLTVSGENVVINSNWTPHTYTITYNLDGGSVDPANRTEYTVETETFTLNNPTWEHFNFTGWTGSNGDTPATTVTIEKGSIGDRTYTANYEVGPHDGTCGDNVYYLYDSTSKTLNIFGSGAMADYSAYNMPWYNSGYRGDITTVVIANGVTHIGSYAFLNCSALTSVTIPNSVTSIGTGIFINCSNLTTITVDAGNTKYDSRNNCNAIIRKSDNVLIAGCKNSIIPNDVTSIGNNAFNGCSSLTSIEIPSSVTSIGGGSFYQCTSLASVIIYAPSLDFYGTNAFDDNASGRKIYVPMASVGTYKTNWPAYENDIVGYNGTCGASGHESDVRWGYEAGTLTIMKVGETGAMADYASATDQPWYSYRENITSVVIEDGVTSIGNHAFDGCSALTSATIYAPSLTTYGTNAFDGNAAGRKIFVYYDCMETYKAKASDMGVDENDIEPISDGTCGTNVYYSYNSNRKTLCIFGTGAMNNYTGGDAPWYSYHSGITKAVIGDGVTSIGDEAFNGCTGLTSITIPASVTTIGNWGFSGCSSLTSITIPASVTSIGNWGFSGCSSLTSITIPASVTSIGYRVFEGCSNLASMTVDEGNTVYDSRNGCNAIIETATNTLITGCKNTVIPNTVTSIDYAAFWNCTNLTSITIPASVTSIGDAAFFGCTGLTSLTIYAPELTYYGSNAFDGNADGRKIYVPFASVDTYKTAWSKYADDIEAIPTVASGTCGDNLTWRLEGTAGNYKLTISGTGAMNNYAAGGAPWYDYRADITSVGIEDGVTSIGNYAFYGCSSLASITIPNSVTSIGDYAFDGCTGLTSVTIYAPKLTYYGSNAFDGNASGRKIYVPMASLDTYQTNWSEYAGDIVGLSFSYLDASGNTQYCTDFTVLDNTMNYLAEGWYVVNSDVTYSDDLYTNGDGDVNIILCDGATLTANNITPTMSVHDDRLRIYGQSQGTGTANISGTLAGYHSLTIYGGTINANILDGYQGSVGINGGTVNVGSISPYGGVSFIGGNVIVTGEVKAGSYSNIFLSGGTVKASSYSASDGYVYISKGLTYYDGEGNSYTGTEEHDAGFLNLTSTEIAAIAGKTLRTFDYRGGTCGDPNVNEGKNVTWLYNMDTHTLTISGTGAMKDYDDGGAPWYSHCADITKVVISNGVTSIGSNAFFKCNNTGFTTIAIPASVTNIGDDAFWGCTSLTDVYYYANPTETLLSNWDRDGDDFKAEKATKCHVFDIDDWDDFTNPNVTFVNVTFVGDLAGKNEFSPVLWGYDNGTQTLTISGTGAMADYNSDNQPWKGFRGDITSVVIEDGVTSIGNNAFKDCPSLASVEIPASVTSIGNDAFEFCTGLTSVTIYAPELTYYGSNAFDGNADGRKIYVFSDCVTAYKAGWSGYAADILPIEGIDLTANAHDGNYWTTFYCSDTNYKIDEGEDAWAYTAEYDAVNSQLTLHKLGKVIPKNTAVIIVGADASIDMTALCNAVAEYSVGNNLRGVDVRTEKSTLGSGTFYVLGKQNDNFGFFQYTGDYMPARKAYLLVPGSAAPGLKMVFDNETTEIKTTDFTDYTDKADAWYSLDGRKLDAQPTKPGLYINNGRKVVVK